MRLRPTRFEEALIIEPEPHEDERGLLARTYCEREFEAHGLNTEWVQHNHTRTRRRGSVRGLHWQAAPRPEIKLVRCVAGRVWDVIVDVRRTSPTYGQWDAIELSADSMEALYIPAGFAHGFQCLDDQCELLYLMSEFYDPDLASGVHCSDDDLAISWPHPVVNLSARDENLPRLRELG